MPYRKICAACLCAAVLTPSALALYPSEIQAGAVGNSPELIKIYELTPEDTPDDIPRDAFELDGYKYTFFEITRDTPLPTTETKDYSETITLSSQSKDMESILSLLATEKECTTEDGYEGTLRLDVDSIHSEVAGYGSSSKKVSVTRRYPNFAGADLENVPKTTTENGITYSLDGVTWESSNTAEVDGYSLTDRYTAVATYSGTKKSQYVDGYTITATYSGILVKSHTPVTRYTAIFVGKLIDPSAKKTGTENIIPSVPGSFADEDSLPSEDFGVQVADAPVIEPPASARNPIPWNAVIQLMVGIFACIGAAMLLIKAFRKIDFRKLKQKFKRKPRRERTDEEDPISPDGDLSDDDSPVYPGFGADV